jgi:hypothetical protein
MHQHRQILGDTQDLYSCGELGFCLLFSGDLLACSQLSAILTLSELLRGQLRFSFP